ncbi:MAG TPA: vanadium-dependent haloperoxidase [Candidatus Limnocylindrales bacterium]|nr:vanadium-dependent haloperoxidase [Candidatus Limnocylindrales bacterium]
MISSRPTKVRQWIATWVAILTAAATLLIPGSSVAAAEPGDMVLEWNTNAILTIGNAPAATPAGLGHVPPLAPIELAMVHGAIYDAVNAIDGSRDPYIDGLSAPASASKAAATARAARDVLLGLVASTPAPVVTSIEAMYAASLARIPDAGEAEGIAVGAAAATAMLANRVGDGRTGTHTFATGTDAGEWRVVPPGNTNLFAYVAFVRPFTLKSYNQLVTEGPPALDSELYTAEFNEVKALGAQTGSSRTPEQTSLANFVIGNPFVFMNKGLRDLATARGLSTADQARLFVMTSMASADAFIACWYNKDKYLFWRPQTAIREAAEDGNPATVADPNWFSLFPTPGYPDEPSGYNCTTAATWHAAKAFFGTDRVSFSLTSPGTGAPGAAQTRHYIRFTDVVDDTIDGRIYTGFHFRFADVHGAWIGKKSAQWGAKHFFGPVN